MVAFFKMLTKCFVLLIISIPIWAHSATYQVDSIHFVPADQDTTVTIEGRGNFLTHIFSLKSPHRVVVDFNELPYFPQISDSSFDEGVVKKIRVARHGNGWRLVFDVDGLTNLQNTFAIEDNGESRLQLHFLSVATLEAPQEIYAAPLEGAKPIEQKEIQNHEEVPPPSSSFRHARDIVVVIDAGHGGKDPGAKGANGYREKDVVLEISKILANEINKKRGFVAYLTRDGDYYLTLRQRLDVARRYKADMFVAIHADAYREQRARGVSIFALSDRGATSEAARWLAERENESELLGGVKLSDKNDLLRSVLLNLSQAASIHASLDIGMRVMQMVGQVAELHHHRIEQAAFVVLKSPDIPSLLVETGFISNPTEEHRLIDRDYQEQLAKAIQGGVCDYFSEWPPRGTWLADHRAR